MTKYHSAAGRRLAAAGCVLLVLITSGCAGKNKNRVPPDPAIADQYLMQRGREALAKKHWMDSREFFHQILDNYSGSPLRSAAKLALGDSYLGEGSTESLILAGNEYREFMTFYPTDERLDYAQYQLAMTHFKEMKKPDRDQTATKEALAEFDTFFQRFPSSPLTPEVRQKWRIARDRLSEGAFTVGVFYYKKHWYPGAADRFNEVIREDPGYTHIDAVYYYLAETFASADRKGEAIPLFDRVVKEYRTSEYLSKAQKRLQELNAQ